MILRHVAVCALALVTLAVAPARAQDDEGARPNFLLIVFEDMSPHIGAYGDPVAQTPVLDAFARQSVLYEAAFTTAGVCAPSRAALAMGVPQQSIGAQHMRVSSGVTLEDGSRLPYTAVPPPYVKAYPELLRRAGYYTSNNGKTDLQIGLDSYRGGPFTIWDDSDAAHPWRGRREGQPFFAMVNVMETHESWTFPLDLAPDAHPMAARLGAQLREALTGRQPVHSPSEIVVPPFLPDTPMVRAELAQMYDNIHYYEQTVARLLGELEEDGLLDETVVIVTTDHGDGIPRAKRSLYDSGLHVPLMVRWPGGQGAGTRDGQLVSFVDIAPTILRLAGEEVPGWMAGRVFLGSGTGPERGYVYAALDRHDEQPDFARAVRDDRWKYIRNYQTELPFFRHLAFRDMQRSMQELWRLHETGELPPRLEQYFTAPRPEEELYDTWADPYEMTNLAQDDRYGRVLARMRGALERYQERFEDLSMTDELAMVERMWPGLEQPVTSAPVIEETPAGLVRLVSQTPGASIGYRIDGGRWQLYVEPLGIEPGQRLEAKAVRYGFAESAVSSIVGG
ncbi:sulfatase family protein [Aurantiacibacter poecillastricola]|uniref:sulfatase family protein n=1 Tax=Aurantiacibacter poecillastricola TaxID=3064385 RepID=UPI00273D000F|nr:sulfatase [Aurantiacibacter sp. 219JJ12-13]MDP5262927.1 sulfatase [Aurantiacibacter sp. 219JJ12-13]